MAVKAKVRTPVLPWSDLGADVQPFGLATIPDDLAPVLAVLSALGPFGPKLVATDSNGNLQIARPLGSQSALNTPAVNTNAVVTLTPPGGSRIVIDSIIYSYNAAPTGGRITIVDGATTVMDIDDTGAGQQALLQGTSGLASLAIDNAVVITLFAAGAAVTGKLFAMFHTVNV